MTYCIKCGNKAEFKIPEGDTKKRLVCSVCSHIHYENPNIICGCLPIYKNKVLMCKRAIEPRYGYWTIPAGFMEIGETVAEGAARETVEEAEAIVENLSLYCMYDLPQIGHVNMFYLSDIKNGDFGVGPESLECALFSEEEIPWDDLAFPTVKKTLEHYFSDRKQPNFNDDVPIHKETIIKK